jgi:hypothetical protein
MDTPLRNVLMPQEPSPPTPPEHQPPQSDRLLREILQSSQATERQLQRLNNHKLITAYNSTSQLLTIQFLKGAAFGLGSVIGATVFVSLIIYLLSQVAFLPIIGEWIKILLEEIHK